MLRILEIWIVAAAFIAPIVGAAIHRMNPDS